jgi:phage protein D
MSQTTSTAPMSSVRRPRLRIVANGTALTGAISANVSSSSHYASDTFRAAVSMSADPAFNDAFWASQSDIDLQISMGFLPPGAAEGAVSWVPLVDGAVDQIHIDIISGIANLEGRDKSALFIDAKTTDTFSNHTASEIATILAGRHPGMTANVTKTTTLVGQYYQLEHDKTTLNSFSRASTEWDLLTYLAQREGFDVWVSGNVLNFHKPPTSTTPPFIIQYTPPGTASASPSLNVMDIHLERSLILAKDAQVTVKSWDSKNNKATTTIVRAPGAKNPNSTNSTTQNYVYVKPGLSKQAAIDFGQAQLAELTKHERIVTVEMPGELAITNRTMVQLAGTGTAFDQVYFVDTVDRSLSFDGGFHQTLRLKNSSPRTQTTVQ